MYRAEQTADWSWEWFATVGTQKQRAITSNSVTLTTSVQSGAVLKSSAVLQLVVVIVCAQLSPNTHKRKGREEKWTQRRPTNVMSSTSVQVSFPPLPLNPICFSTDLAIRLWKGSAFLYMSAPSLCLYSVQRARGLWRVIASRCPCTSSAVWTPGL